MLCTMAALQLNDQDPLLWVTVYLSVGVVAGVRLVNQKCPLLFGITVGMVLSCVLISVPGFLDYLHAGDLSSVTGNMSADKPYVEAAREFLGMVIAGMCLACYGQWHTRDSQN